MKLPRITREIYDVEPKRYSLVPGTTQGAPNCPFGNHYRWVGYDNREECFVEFSSSVYKKLVRETE